MADEPAAAFNDIDVRSLAAKLKGLHALLTPGEQALLHTYTAHRTPHTAHRTPRESSKCSCPGAPNMVDHDGQ
jgi:hypothetical protein